MKLLSLIFLFFSLPAFATQEQAVQKQVVQEQAFTIRLISPYTTVKKQSAFMVAVQIKMAEDWYSYWSYAGDFGVPPRIVNPQLHSIQIKELALPRPERKSFAINNKTAYSFVYYKELLIPLEIFIPKSYNKDTLELSLQIEWGLCKDICLSKTTNVNLNLNLADSFQKNETLQPVFDFWSQYYPKKPKEIKDLNLKSQFTKQENQHIVSFTFDKKIQCLDVLPRSPLDFLATKPLVIYQNSNSCSFQIEKSKSQLDVLSGLLVYSQNNQKHSTFFSSQKKQKLGLIWFIFMAFLGGLILNIMPCVLPIIFLKFYNNLELKNLSRKRQFLLNVSFSAGVILSFLALALFIFISKQTGETLGWGFHLQSPLFVSVLALLFTIMGFYLMGYASFATPKIPKLFKDQKVFSHFLTGVLSTTAASPCTVPFMASAVGFAFSRSYVEIFSIFFFLGFGLSFPYLLLSFFPQVFKYIPSPGAWSERVKKVFSLPLFLTSLWLLSILYLQLNLKIFLFTLLIFPLAATEIFLRTKLTKSTHKLTLSVIVITLIITILSLQVFLKTPQQEVKVSSFLNSNWQNFDHNKVAYDQTLGKNIFISFGAKWCLTCKLNERIFNKLEFQKLIENHDIQLYYGDWTNKADDISSFLEQYSRQGVPFYIFYKGEEKAYIFPTLLLEKDFYHKLNELLGS